MKKSKDITKEICPLFCGGRCPICDDEWFDLGMSYEEGKRINRECCKNHRDLTDEEWKEFLGDKHKN